MSIVDIIPQLADDEQHTPSRTTAVGPVAVLPILPLLAESIVCRG